MTEGTAGAAMSRVYVDMVGDLFHAGHVALLREARRHGDWLIVGVLSDETAASYKRRPIMSLDERVAVIESCRYVDEVIPDSPDRITREFLEDHRITTVVHGDDLSQEGAESIYGPAVDAGTLVYVPRTGDISTTDLIRRARDAAGRERNGATEGTGAQPGETNEHGQGVGDRLTGWASRPVPSGVPLRGAYVTARPIDREHSQDLFEALCAPDDAALWTYRPGLRPRTVEELDREVVRRLADHPESATFAFVPTGGTAAGLATFFPCVTEHGVIEISGVLWSRRMQRTAAATEAIHLMLTHAFEDLGYRRVEWKCDSLNEPSRQAALRLGFTPEGRFRQHMVIHGRNRDTDWFSMLDSEWPAVRDRHRRWLDPGNFDEHSRQRRRLRTGRGAVWRVT